ncbi:hypothetical protein [Phytoactinopolyspora limicola]|uniref:hypothetical protein n=1 Tax=Phytoactinopolyspora limicola TaxID=2715536 RepID=UPI00140CA727|nr:hypothetical protein [Phytoactinopolyspora limicola]
MSATAGPYPAVHATPPAPHAAPPATVIQGRVGVGSNIDWVRRVARRFWPHFHLVVAASLPFGVLAWLVANLTPPVLVPRIGLAGLVLAAPTALLVLVAHRIATQPDSDDSPVPPSGRPAPSPRWVAWRRLTGVTAAVMLPALLTLIGFDAWGATGSPVFFGSALFSGCVTVLAAAGAVVALPLGIEYPQARWRYLWWVSLAAVARRPVPVLGALVFVAASGYLAGRWPITLTVVPAASALVVVAAAWTSLATLGVHPTIQPRRP